MNETSTTQQKTLLAGGCFWCVEAAVRNIPGVIEVFSGYAGEPSVPTRREVVEITYNPQEITFEELIKASFTLFDPTDPGGQFYDRGFAYTTAVYYQDEAQKLILENIINDLNMSGVYDAPIATCIEPVGYFDPAPEYHQKYKEKNPDHYQQYYEASGRKAYIEQMETNK